MNIIDYLARKQKLFIWTISLLLNLIVGIIDYLTGYELGVEIFYLIPMCLLSWFVNLRATGIIMSIISIVTIFCADYFAGEVIHNPFVFFWNLLICFGFFATVVYLMNMEKISTDKNVGLTIELRSALDEIKILKGLLPVCSSCEKILDDNGDWKEIDCYIREHSEAKFNHSICPECKRKLYPELTKKN